MYGFMLAGLSSANILILLQPCPKNGRPMYRSMLAVLSSASIYDFSQSNHSPIQTGQCSTDLCRTACLPPICLILVQSRPKTAGRQYQYRPTLASKSSASIILILVKPWNTIAGRCFALCYAGISDLGPTAAEDCRFLLPVFLTLVQPQPKTAGQCIARAHRGVLKSWSTIRFPPTTTKQLIRKEQKNCDLERKKNRSKETVAISEVCFFFVFYLQFNGSSHSHSLRAISGLAYSTSFVSVHHIPSKFQS